MRIETIRYKRSHNKNPWGFGKWAFDFETTEGRVTLAVPEPMDYLSAKTWAIRQAHAMPNMDSDQIFVAP